MFGGVPRGSKDSSSQSPSSSPAPRPMSEIPVDEAADHHERSLDPVELVTEHLQRSDRLSALHRMLDGDDLPRVLEGDDRHTELGVDPADHHVEPAHAEPAPVTDAGVRIERVGLPDPPGFLVAEVVVGRARPEAERHHSLPGGLHDEFRVVGAADPHEALIGLLDGLRGGHRQSRLAAHVRIEQLVARRSSGEILRHPVEPPARLRRVTYVDGHDLSYRMRRGTNC
jgi:hypothetical protein